MNRILIFQPTPSSLVPDRTWPTAVFRASIAMVSLIGILTVLFAVLSPIPEAEGHIMFTGNREGRQGLYVMNVLTGAAYRVPQQEQRDTEAVWSPDGAQIALVGQSGTYCNRGIFVIDSDGSNRRRLTGCYSDALQPAWSPDGSQIVFVAFRRSSTDLYVIDQDGTNLQNLTSDNAVENSPSWSPDGSRVTFATSRDGNWEIYVVDSDGRNLVRLTDHEAADWDPAWSPDGSRIVFVSNRGGASYELYTMNPDGSDLRKLSHSVSEDQNPSWSPDGRQIAFTSQRDGFQALYVMDVRTGIVFRMSSPGTFVAHPSWHP